MKRKSALALGVVLILVLVISIYIYTYSGSLRKVGGPDQGLVEEQPVTILFVGDIMLDRGVRNAINREGVDYPFEGIKDLLENNDLVVGNLEGTFTTEPSVSADGTRLKFTFDPGLVAMLKKYNFSGFSLANNHTLDFGQPGYESTKTYLAKQDMFYFGSALNDDNLSARVVVDSEVLCFVGYHSLYREDTTPVVTEIQTLKDECGYITIFAHWGEEYQGKENDTQRRLGRSFIDAGADLVIGHHPHVVQPVEVYKGKAIFYSLGNFLFDQDFSLATRQNLAVRLRLTEGEQSFELVPLEMSRARLYYPESEPVNVATTTRMFTLPR